jgi:hypothetical protein
MPDGLTEPGWYVTEESLQTYSEQPEELEEG